MKYTIAAAILALVTVILVFYAMIYPAWFSQNYKVSDPNVFQGFGIWAFYSSSQLSTPFYASETAAQYNNLCNLDTENLPNWMLGAKSQYINALCSGSMTAIQILVAFSASISVVCLIASVAAVYFPSAGKAEKIVSVFTLLGAMCLSISMVLWGWLIQQDLYDIDPINQQYQSCKSSGSGWSCWFYGRCFWTGLASVISFSITGYLSSAGRSAKILSFRKQYQDDMQMAIQASMMDAGPYLPPKHSMGVENQMPQPNASSEVGGVPYYAGQENNIPQHLTFPQQNANSVPIANQNNYYSSATPRAPVV